MKIRYMEAADDPAEISKVYEESWKHAYRGIIPQAYLDSIPKGRWAPALCRNDWHTLVCVENGQIIGTSSFCKSRLEQLRDWGEIVSLYLLPAYMGKGYGKALLQAAVGELERRGYERIFLWVLEENRQARGFYEKFAFQQSEDFLDENIGGKMVRELRYIYQRKEADKKLV